MIRPVKQAEFLTAAVKPSGYPPPGPPEIVFAGRSNVGKSSLINCLTGRKKLVRVSNRPGRTQQINFFSINQDQIRFVDLPGYGFAKVPLSVKHSWQKMIEVYLTTRPTLSAVVSILDIRRGPTPDDLNLLAWLKAQNITILIAVTKADKLSRNQQNNQLRKSLPQIQSFDPTPTLFSSQTGQGRKELWARIEENVGGKAPDPTLDGEAS